MSWWEGAENFSTQNLSSVAKCPFLSVVGLKSFSYLLPQRKTNPVPNSIPVAGWGWGWVQEDWACPAGERVALLETWQRSASCSAAQCLSLGWVCRSSVCLCWRLLSVCGIPCSSLSACASQLSNAALLRHKQWSHLTVVPATIKPCICASRIKHSGALSVLIRITA